MPLSGKRAPSTRAGGQAVGRKPSACTNNMRVFSCHPILFPKKPQIFLLPPSYRRNRKVRNGRRGKSRERCTFGIDGLKNKKNYPFYLRLFSLLIRFPARGFYPATEKQVFQGPQQLREFGGIDLRPGNDDYGIAVRQVFCHQTEGLLCPAADPVSPNSMTRCSSRAKPNFAKAFFPG